MIGFLRGKLLTWKEDYVVIDVQGVGYQVFIPASVLSHLPRKGEELALQIYTSVREDAIQLYGFLTESELELFKLLIGVSGIGPKVASGILSTLKVTTFRQAIVYEDVTALKKIPGIGEKTAKRLILELKNKLEKVDLGLEGDVEEPMVQTPAIEEGVEALMALGYGRSEAFSAIEKIDEREDLQVMIRQALKYLGQR